jgi:Ni/Fe-hydrogenase subunit HybB-like protein
VSRIAEQIAVAAVALAGIIIVTDMGRPDRVLNVFLHGRFASPILWDITVITTYLTISLLLVWLPLIPDMAMLKNKMTDIPKWKYNLYNILSLGWEGTEKQYIKLKRNMRILMILIIPVALAIHTVTSWLFAATLRPGWDTTIFGPYFVTGAFVAGSAAVVMLMYIYRKRFNLKEYLTDYHFDQMGKVVVLFRWFTFIST